MSQVFEIVLTENDTRYYATFRAILNIMPALHHLKIEAGLANAWIPANIVNVRNENLEPDTVLIVHGNEVYSVFRHSVIDE